jgi:hypothetical protein
MKMLNIMILNEYKRNFYRLLNEGAAEMYRDAYYPEVDDYLLEKIIEIDPDSNGDNLSDYGKLLLKLKPDMRDIEQVRQDIEIYAKADKNGVEVPVVNTIEELHYAAVDLANANAHMSNDEITNKEQSLDCPVVYSDGEFNVIEICDRESAIYYGKGTTWVWGANNGDMFDQYAQRGKIYVIFEKSAGKKYSAINLGKRIRLTDERDEPADKSRFPQQLMNAIMGVNESKKKTKKMLQEKSSLPMSNNDFEVVFENASWKIVIPKTFAAAVKWGKHTAWDTANAREGERYFNYYNERGPLYIIINKETKEKYQYHKDAGLFDAMDSEVDFNQLPQEIASKIVGVNENKVMKLTQNDLISMLSEAVNKALNESFEDITIADVIRRKVGGAKRSNKADYYHHLGHDFEDRFHKVRDFFEGLEDFHIRGCIDGIVGRAIRLRQGKKVDMAEMDELIQKAEKLLQKAEKRYEDARSSTNISSDIPEFTSSTPVKYGLKK